MKGSASLLKQLEESISQGSDESLTRALWHATDLLIAGQYSEKDIWIFGEVIERLAREITAAARAELARRLAHSKNAPVNFINQLANDNSIDVAGPSFDTRSGSTFESWFRLLVPKASNTCSQYPIGTLSPNLLQTSSLSLAIRTS